MARERGVTVKLTIWIPVKGTDSASVAAAAALAGQVKALKVAEEDLPKLQITSTSDVFGSRSQ